MFYLQMRPPGSPSTPSSSVVTTRPGRPKSAAPAIAVPTATTTLGISVPPRPTGRVSPGLSPRTAYVGFSPRSLMASRSVAPITTTLGAAFEDVVYARAPQQSIASPRADSDREITREQFVPPASNNTGNVYHAMMARKNAEEAERRLARRIAHCRAQEERVLREVQEMKQRLENLLQSHGTGNEVTDTAGGGLSRSTDHAAKCPLSASTHASRLAQRSDVKTPRSREQLQFLTKQRRVIQHRKIESARKQKEKRQEALDAQREKDVAEQSRRAALKERIQRERQLAIDQRAARQQQLLDALEQQHHARLRNERARELEAKQRISEMKEEEKNVTLRLQALQVHQEHMKRGLAESQQTPIALKAPSLRPKSARQHKLAQ